MAFDFIFESPEKTDRTHLQQGDILQKSSAMIAALNEAHAYYADADDYKYFMVLTQSCDLVRRNNKPPKSKYITVAAIRPLDILVSRLIKKYKFDSDIPLSICSKNTEIFVSQYLERLMHNTESGLFFIRKNSHSAIAENLCVFLPLSIALKAEHYQVCLDSKIAQLESVFQAKVGWLTGNMYSRVGTPDIDEIETDAAAIKREFYEEVLYRHTAWLTPGQYKVLKSIIVTWKKNNPGEQLTTDIARELVNSVPEHIDIIAERAIQVLKSNDFIDNAGDTAQRAANLLKNDLGLQKLVKSAPNNE
jgi:hypothetical protein